MSNRSSKQRIGHGVGFAGMGALVFAFIVLSLAITATGTARFAVAMNYPAVVGYAVGGIFDFAKELLPVGLLVLFRRRSFILFAIIGCAWVLLVIYSALATHATVSTAIAAIERNGTWKWRAAPTPKPSLLAVEQRLNVLSQPTPPRPSKTLAETLAAEKVPPGVWRDSQECQAIRESKYFQTACARVLDLRRELAAAEDYEKLDARAQAAARSPSGCAGCCHLRSSARGVCCHTRPCPPARRPRRSGTSPDLSHRDHQLLRISRVAGAQGGRVGEGGNIR